MKKISKFLLTLAVIACIGSSVLQIGFISKMKDDLVALGKQGVHYFISLNQRIKALEKAQNDLPAMGEDVEDETKVTETHTADTAGETTTEKHPTCDTTAQEPQETTKPTLSGNQDPQETTPTETRPESVTTAATQPPTQDTAIPPTSQTTPQNYRISIYQGIIGVFDKEGNLIDTCNVYVMSLPQKDREMLTVGLMADTLEEVQAILENFV